MEPDAACSGRVFYGRLLAAAWPLASPDIGQEGGQQANKGQIGADLVDGFDAGGIGQSAQQGGPYPSHTEGEAEEEAGNGADLAGYQILGVDQDGGEGRRQDEADDDRQHRGPEQVDVGQQQGEGSDAEDGDPDHPLATDAIAERPAEHRPRRDGKQEGEQIELGALQRQVELVHQVEGVIAAQAGHVEELGEHQQTEDGQ